MMKYNEMNENWKKRKSETINENQLVCHIYK